MKKNPFVRFFWITCLLSAGCTGKYTLTTEDIRWTHPPAGWEQFSKGTRVILVPKEECKERIYTQEDWQNNPGSALISSELVHAGEPYTIDVGKVLVEEGRRPNELFLKLRSEKNDVFWVSIPSEKQSGVSCVMVSGGENATEYSADTEVYYAPWRSGCGQHTFWLTKEAGLPDVGQKLTASTLVRAPAATGEKKLTQWRQLGAGLLIEEEAVEACFSKQEYNPSAEGPTSIIGVDRSRCIVISDAFACHTTIRAMERKKSGSYIQVSQVRRTVGPVLLTEKGLGSPSMLAQENVKVSVYTASKVEAKRTGDFLLKGLPSHYASWGVTSPDRATMQVEVHVDVAGVTIGELVTLREKKSSRYQSGTKTVKNPKKEELEESIDSARDSLPKLEQRVDDAESRLREAEKDDADADREAEKNREECLRKKEEAARELRETKSKEGRIASGIVDIGGSIACNSLGNSSHKAPEAKRELNRAESEYLNAKEKIKDLERQYRTTPSTIEEPVFDNWVYEHRTLKRQINVVLDMEFKYPGQDSVIRRVNRTIDITEQDVTADSYHNVKGITPNESIHTDPSALMGAQGAPMVEEVARAIGSLLKTHRNTQIDRALSSRGIRADSIEEKDIARTAWKSSGQRLLSILKKPTPQPAQMTINVPQEHIEGGCVFVLAISKAGESIRLSGGGGILADNRNGAVAHLEVCPSDPQEIKEAVRSLSVSGASKDVVVALYRAEGR